MIIFDETFRGGETPSKVKKMAAEFGQYKQYTYTYTSGTGVGVSAVRFKRGSAAFYYDDCDSSRLIVVKARSIKAACQEAKTYFPPLGKLLEGFWYGFEGNPTAPLESVNDGAEWPLF